MLYKKELSFQKRHTTAHAIVQLACQIQEMFNKIIYTRDIFIDPSKAFETVNHKFLLKRFSHYGIKNKNLDWFTCNLSKRKQFICYNVNNKSNLLHIVRGVPQGSILRSFLFLLYINDLPQSSKLLDPIKSADDTNSFY